MKKWFIVLAILPTLLYGQIQLPLALQTPPRGTSYCEMVQFLKNIISESNSFEMELGAKSHGNREIPILFFPKRTEWKKDNATIMLFAQQHGNEPSGKEALLMLIYQLYRNPESYGYNLILIPMVNPDGNEAHIRKNSREADLNRNHLILTEPETQTLHQLFDVYKPEVTLDIHEYSINPWLNQGYIKDFGEQLDCLSNMAIPKELKQFAVTKILEPTLTATRARGVKANRYLICQSDVNHFVRHSTTDINDGRNSFGIRYTLSFILEGANGFSKEDRIWQRAKHQLVLIENFLKICNENSHLISKFVNKVRHKYTKQIPDSIVIQANYTENSSKKLNVTLRRTSDFKDTTIVLQDYRPDPEAIVMVKRPHAYVIKQPEQKIIDLLKHQQIEYLILTSPKTFSVEQFLISGPDTLKYESRDTIIPHGSFSRIKKTFHSGDMMIPTNNVRANHIVLIMEPQSFYGLSHYDEFQFLLKNKIYPIYRVVK